MAKVQKRERDPVRCCVGCRQREPAARLLRFVAHDGRLAVDVSRRLEGRGAWAHPRRGCIDRGLRRGGFSHVLRRPISDDPERLVPEAEHVYGRETCQQFGLLRRSGVLPFGRHEALSAVQSGGAAAVWLADDAAVRTAREVRSVTGESVPVFTIATGAELGASLGTRPVVVIAIPASPAGKRAVDTLALWTQLRREAMVYKPDCGA